MGQRACLDDSKRALHDIIRRVIRVVPLRQSQRIRASGRQGEIVRGNLFATCFFKEDLSC